MNKNTTTQTATSSTKNIVCFGPGPAFKGGLSDYNASLVRALCGLGQTQVHLVSWNEQYPSIIPRDFKDRVSKASKLAGVSVECKYITNFNNPFSWERTAKYIASLHPQIVVFQWSIALQGLPLGYIIRRLKRLLPQTELIVDLHFVVQKERSQLDRFLTKFGISRADTYIVHALKTFDELKALFAKQQFQLSKDSTRSKIPKVKTVLKLYHPIYDLFQPVQSFDVEAFKREHGLRKHVFLFFGFIRKYKGLHNAIAAFAKIAKERGDVSLLICGESFWATLDQDKFSTKVKNLLFGLAKKVFLGGKDDDERNYRPLDLIDHFNIHNQTVVFNRFIPNEEVHKFFQTSDCVLLYYLTATPSGIESLSYNFALPILATKVGHFPETIRHGYNGYLAEANDLADMADQMRLFLEKPLPRDNIRAVAAQLSWENYAKTIVGFNQ